MAGRGARQRTTAEQQALDHAVRRADVFDPFRH
jgi:hypothetical protein